MNYMIGVLSFFLLMLCSKINSFRRVLSRSASYQGHSLNRGSFRSFLAPSFAKKMEFRENPELRSLVDLPAKENTLQKYLIAEDVEPKRGDQIYPRQVKGCHFTFVLPEPVRKPELVIASEDCARSLGLNPSEVLTPLFTEVFAGNAPISGFDKSYATVYGCHCYGQWFGQNGDGRATILGEVHYHYNLNDTHYYSNSIQELQLKGAGRTPYSRGFDGRAVLRSSIREFLASEFMFHLGVPTTRALSVSLTFLLFTAQFNLYLC